MKDYQGVENIKDFGLIYNKTIMNKKEIINEVIKFVKSELTQNDAGHDWWHIYRVWNLSKTIWKKEGWNMFIIELWALLHDIADHKFYNWDETIWPKKAREILEKLKVEESIIEHIVKIIENVSFSKSLDWKREFNSLELQIVQDADMMDAIGAIGIARTFVYGWHKWREIHNPNIEPKLNMTKDEYRKDTWPTINHFYEKLLLLKDKMNTSYWKKMAENRHNYMQWFLEQFLSEWEGEK